MSELDSAFFVAKSGFALVLVVATNAISGSRERIADRGIGLAGARRPCLSLEKQLRGTSTVEALGVIEHGLIPPFANRIEDRAHVGLDASEILVTPTAEGEERLLVAGGAPFEDPEHLRVLAVRLNGSNRENLALAVVKCSNFALMTVRLHNTLTGRKEPFEPAEPGHARIYVCGPTVYDYAHLGHARCYVVYDVLVRHLRSNGLRVTYVRNVTDVDDKILKRASETGTEPMALAGRFAEAYAEDMHRLGNLDPDVEPRVSTHLEDIFNLVHRLIDRGHAYVSDGDVYFSVESFPEYGKLSHRDLEQMKTGASERLDDKQTARKRHPADFALWKKSDGDAWGWESPWGRGRPGWHIECSAMAMSHLGETLDLHGGGLDLVFPHHENEIAQSEAATGKPFSRCWMHNGFVEVDKEKMSKSLGNFFTARDLFDRVEPEAIRYFMMTVHYRAPLNLDWTLDQAGNVTGFPQFEEAERRIAYLYKTKQRLAALPPNRITEDGVPAPAELIGFADALGKALDDDLNMPVALAKLADFLKSVNELCDQAMRKKGKARQASVEAAERGFDALSRELGLGEQVPAEVLVRIRDRRARERGIEASWVEDRIAARSQARQSKDFAEADRIRDALASRGVELFDGPEGTDWSISD